MKIYKIISIIAINILGVILLVSLITFERNNSLVFQNIAQDGIQLISDSGITKSEQEQILDIDGVTKVMYSTVHNNLMIQIGNVDNILVSSGGTMISDFTTNSEQLELVDGRMPSKFGEIIVSQSLSDVLIANDFITNPVGDKINTGEIYTIVGVYADTPISSVEESIYDSGDKQVISYWSDKGFMIYGDLTDTKNVKQEDALSNLNGKIIYETDQSDKVLYSEYDPDTETGGELLYDQSVANGALGIYDEESTGYGDVFNMQAFIKVDSGERDQVEERLKEIFPYSTIVDSDTKYDDVIKYNYKYIIVVGGVLIINLLIIFTNRNRRN